MDKLEDLGLNREELLLVDELCDEVESHLDRDLEFDVSRFLSEIKNKRVRTALRDEVDRIRAKSIDEPISPNGASVDWRGPKQTLTSGQIIDSFELIEMIGKGATSEVWRARHLMLDRMVALKFPVVFSDDIAKRLARESKAVAKLRHPNIVSIHEFRSERGFGYLVSDLIVGQSLQERMEQGIGTDEAVSLMVAISEAIAYSHSMGVIHRDLKPQNILLDHTNAPHVVDFGLARILHEEQVVLTSEGSMLGTPGYMSPEQATGKDADEISDVYSLGVILFQLLTGRLPFLGNIATVVHQIVNDEAPSVRQFVRSVPRDLETICMKCLAKSPDQRFPSAQELAFELRRFCNGEPIASRPIHVWEKLRHWSKRKPLEAFLAGSLLASLVGLAVGATLFAWAMHDARNKEVALRIKAQTSEQVATRLKDEVESALRESLIQKELAEQRALERENSAAFLQSVFQEPEPFMWVLKGDGVGSGEPPSLKQLFVNAAGRIENEFPGDLRAKANLMEMLGDSCRSLGFFELSKELVVSARAYRVETQTDREHKAVRQRFVKSDEFASLKNAAILAKLEHDTGKFKKAKTAYEECIQNARHFDGEFAIEANKLKAELLFHLGRLNFSMQNDTEGIQCLEESLSLLQASPDQDEFLTKACELAIEYGNLKPGEIPETGPIADFFSKDSWAQRIVQQFTKMLQYRTAGNWIKAGTHYGLVLDTMRERLPEEHPWHLLALGDYADVQWRAGYYDKALRSIEIAIAHGKQLAPEHPQLIRAQIRLGKELCRGNRSDKAMPYLEAGYASIRKDPKTTVNLDLWLELIDQYAERGRFEEAVVLCSDLDSQIDTWSACQTAWFDLLRSRLYKTKDPAKSLEYHRSAIQIASSLSDLPENGIWCDRLATILLSGEKFEKATLAAQNAVKFDIQRFSPNHPRVANRRVKLAECYTKSGDLESAKVELQKAFEIRSKFLAPENQLIEEVRVRLLDFESVQ